MRADSKKQREIVTGEICGYHHGDYEERLVWASDRPQKADHMYRLLSDGSMLPMFGVEVETQNWGIANKAIYANVLKQIVFQFFPDKLWKYENDASLDDHGCDSSAECISQPMTKAFIRNHYRDFKSMFDWFEKLGTSCVRTGDCGMHVHMSITNFGRSKKTQDEALRKFYFIVNHHYGLIRNLVARRKDADNSTYYFGQVRISMEEAKNIDFDTWNPNNHHVAVNLGHYRNGDIEFRLVGGQKNYPCFRNTMESVFYLIDAVKRISWADCLNPVKIFSGCNQYVFDRLESIVHDAGYITDAQLAEIRPTVKNDNFSLQR